MTAMLSFFIGKLWREVPQNFRCSQACSEPTLLGKPLATLDYFFFLAFLTDFFAGFFALTFKTFLDDFPVAVFFFAAGFAFIFAFAGFFAADFVSSSTTGFSVGLAGAAAASLHPCTSRTAIIAPRMLFQVSWPIITSFGNMQPSQQIWRQALVSLLFSWRSQNPAW